MTPLQRFPFVLTTLLTLASFSAGAADETPAPSTGTAYDELQCLDDWMFKFLADHKVPGGSLAVVREGKLVYSRGFGYADRDERALVEPDSLFRIASVSKPITAVAIAQLVERGKLKYDDKVLDIIEYEPHFENGAKLDERWRQVTIAHCLSHMGGWDRGVSYDPMFQALRMQKSLGVDFPITPKHIIRYQLGQPLDFAPGERYTYSNFGYSILGRVIEKLGGRPYDEYVCREVFAPLGITRAVMGKSLSGEQAAGEVRYYDIGEKTGTVTTGPGAGKEKVPISYGVWRQETLDSHGGWIASSSDLARFAAAFDLVENGNATRGKLLTPATVREMFAHHAMVSKPDENGKGAASYGYGWTLKRDDAGHLIPSHGGALACTAAYLVRLPGDLSLAVLFNLGQTPDGKFLGRQIDGTLPQRIRGIERWPAAK